MPDDTHHPDQPHGDLPSERPTTTGGDAAHGPSSPKSGSAEDDLIAAAKMAAEARSDGTPPEPDLPGPDYFPGYVISREIHRGGQGIVYQAVHKGTKRKVAIKVMIEGVLASVRERTRFEREVEILAQLDHPAIVNVHDSGSVEGRFYYVMDYISGSTLDVWISQNEMPIPETLELFAKICNAVNAAHLKGVIHRDLKPANIRIDANGEPHVVDFGLAKIATGSFADDERLMTVTGQFIGSLPWASPEQAQGIPGMIDVRTDVYSLGVVLYQMLTGRFPYQVVGNMRDVLENILRAEPARPSTVRRRINDEVETIVLKCLSKERDRRYQNAGDVSRDIRHYLRGDPIEAKRDSGWYILRKTARRYRGVATAAGLVLVLLVVFAVSMSVLNGQKKRALHDLNVESTARLAIIEELELWLEAPDPTLGEGKDITMRDVVDRAAERLDSQSLADQPQVEASLRSIIGRTYFNLGEWQRAEPHLRRALDLHEASRGKDDLETISTNQRLGVVLRNLVQLDEAQQRLEDARERTERLLGIGDRRTVQVINDLAQLHKFQDENDEAIRLFEIGLRAAEMDPDFDPVLLAVLHGNLAEVLAKEDRVDEAEAMLAACVAALVKAHGESHPNVARARTRQAALLQATARPDEALAQLELALAVFDETLDPTHPDTLATRLRLADLLETRGEADRAIEMFAAVVAAGEATMARDNPVLAWYHHLHGRALLNDGRLTEARRPLERAVEVLRAADHPAAPRAIATLVRLYEADGDEAAAAELRAELPSDGG